jgi:hypothetical protein
MAIDDFDNDGALDVLVAVNNAALVLLRNNVGAKHHWLGVRHLTPLKFRNCWKSPRKKVECHQSCGRYTGSLH